MRTATNGDFIFGKSGGAARVLGHVVTAYMKCEGGYQISGKATVAKLRLADRTAWVSPLGDVDS